MTGNDLADEPATPCADPSGRAPADSGTDALIALTPVLSLLRNRGRPWIATLFLLVASLSTTATAFGMTCQRTAPDGTAVAVPAPEESAPNTNTDPGLAPTACGAPVIAPAAEHAPAAPPLRSTTEPESSTQPAPEPDHAPRERPPLQS